MNPVRDLVKVHDALMLAKLDGLGITSLRQSLEVDKLVPCQAASANTAAGPVVRCDIRVHHLRKNMGGHILGEDLLLGCRKVNLINSSAPMLRAANPHQV